MHRIVVGVDGSDASEKALARAMGEAAVTGAELVLVGVAENLGVLSLSQKDCASAWETLTREPKRIVDDAVRRAREAGAVARGIVEAGRPAEAIARIAQREEADEILVGSLGKHAVDRLLLGSVSGRLVEIAPCTVVVVR